MLQSAKSNLVKYSDYNAQSIGVSTGTILLSVTMPTTGTGETNMSGNAIVSKGFEWRYNLVDLAGALADSYVVRTIMVQAIGAQTLTAAEILQNSSTGILAVVSPFRYDTVNKTFRVLFDKTQFVDTYNSVSFTDAKFPSKVHNMRYDTVGADWATGQPYIMYCVYHVGGVNDLTITQYTRMWFYDV